jgi:glycosyltransferase involved in cell wall biosynthesis
MSSIANGLRIAVTHDSLDQYGGAERTVAAICELLRPAALYTSVYDSDIMRRLGFARPGQQVEVSFMQRLPLRRRIPRYYLTGLYPVAFRSFDLADYDVVVSSASFAAKAVALTARAVHVCYCYTPPRFLWGFDSDTAARAMPPHERPLATLARAVLRRVDQRAAARVNLFLASSKVVANRIWSAYGRRARVIYPPVDTARFLGRASTDEGFLLVVSRLNAYKRIEYVIEACNDARLALVVVGTGPWERRLRVRAGPTVRLTGPLPDSEVERLMASCHAFVLPGEEDFGIAAVEAMAAGKPVLALRRGGATETVIEGRTGLLYDEPTADCLLDAVRRLGNIRFDAEFARSRAREFDRTRFVARLDQAIAFAAAQGPSVFH